MAWGQLRPPAPAPNLCHRQDVSIHRGQGLVMGLKLGRRWWGHPCRGVSLLFHCGDTVTGTGPSAFIRLQASGLSPSLPESCHTLSPRPRSAATFFVQSAFILPVSHGHSLSCL